MANAKIKIKAISSAFSKDDPTAPKQEVIAGYRDPFDERFGAIKVLKEAAGKVGVDISLPKKEGNSYIVRLLTPDQRPFASVTLDSQIHVMNIDDAAIRIRDLVIEAVSSGGSDPAVRAKVLTEEFTTN